MSVETFIQAFERGEPQAIKTKDILECFEGVITARSADYIDVEFAPANSSTIYFDVDSEVETGVMVSRPCGDHGLAKRLYRVMGLGNCVLYTPGEDGYIVVSPQGAEDMKECLGDAQLASSEAAFVALYAL